MTSAIDGMRAKFRYMLMRIDKARQREIAARRRTNEAIQRTKVAEKKAYYLRHKFTALGDKLFINGLILERTLRRLTAVRTTLRKNNKEVYVYIDKPFNEETLEERIVNLEVLELEYNSDAAVLVSKKEIILKNLDEQEDRLSIANDEKKILENRLLKSSEAFRLKLMKRDWDNERRNSRSEVLSQLKRYLQMANCRYRRAIDRVERITKIQRRIVENIQVQNDVTRKTNRELQHTIRLKQKLCESKSLNVSGHESLPVTLQKRLSSGYLNN